MTTNGNIQNFVSYVKRQCVSNGIKFKKVTKPNITLPGGDVVAGYFTDSPKPIIAVAMNQQTNGWLTTLVHEFSHAEQFLEHDPTYAGRYGNTTADDIIKKWMQGHDYEEATIDACLDIQKKCELNCERRAIKNIKKFDLPLDTMYYAQVASSYIHYFNYMKMTRRWNPPLNKFPSEVIEIIQEMPSNLRGHYKKMSRSMIKLYDTYLGYC